MRVDIMTRQTGIPIRRPIAYDIAWVAALVLISRAAGALKEIALAWRYGTGPEIDAYVFVLSFVNWPVTVWFSVVSIVLVPLVAARPDAGSQVPVGNFRAELFGATLLFALGLFAMMFLGLPYFISSGLVDLPDSTRSLALGYVLALTVITPIGILIGVFSAWIMAGGKQTNTLLEGVPALVLALAVLVPIPAPLIWGSIAGALVHLVVVASPWLQGVSATWPSFRMQAQEWAAFRKGIIFMVIGQALMSLITIIDQLFAATLAAGTISSLGYSNRVLALALGVGAIAASRATLVMFSRRSGKSDLEHRSLARRWAGIMFIGGACVALVGWWLAPVVIALLFERGAFTATDTAIVSSLLRIGLTQIPFYFSAIILVSFLASRGRYTYIALGAGLNLLIKVALTFLLIPQFGAEGMLWATSIMYFCSLLVLIAGWARTAPGNGPSVTRGAESPID